MMRDILKGEGHFIGRKHVATLIRTMGIEALYRRPKTSRRHAAHRIYPYLLRNLRVERPNLSGRWISLTGRWLVVSSISRRSWTGQAGGCSPGACRSA